MQPFSKKTAEIIFIAIGGYLFTEMLFGKMEGLASIILSVLVFGSIFLFFIYWRNITPDAKPVLNALLKRLGFIAKREE